MDLPRMVTPPGWRRSWRRGPPLVVVLGMVALLAGCARTAVQPATASSAVAPSVSARYTTPRPADPVRLTVVGDHPPDIATWYDASDAVVVATVRQVFPARWTTPDGARPANPHDPSSAATIVTPVAIEVERSLTRAPPGQRLLLAAQGGAVGEDTIARDDGLATFREGERVVLFLQARDRTLAGLPDRPVWEVLERYTVTPEGMATNPYATLSMPQLINQIAALQRRP